MQLNVSARSLFELTSTVSNISANAKAFANCPSKENRKDLFDAIEDLTDLANTISGEAFEAIAELEMLANKAEIRAAFAEAQAQQK